MIEVLVDTNSYDSKPTLSTGAIQNCLAETPIRHVDSLEMLKLHIESGRTIRPGLLKEGSSSQADFIKAQIIMCDIDSYEEKAVSNTLKLCKKIGLEPWLIYPSFSYKTIDKKEKLNNKPNPHYNEAKYNHRLCFMFEEEIYDAELYKKQMNALIKVFGGDKRCKDAGRIFYGTNQKSSYFSPTARIKAGDLEQYMIEEEPKEKEKAKPKAKKTEYREKEVIINNIESFFENNDTYSNLTFECPSDFKDFIFSIPIDDMLGTGIGAFKCIFHMDSNPSASVYRDSNDRYKYKCHSGCIGGHGKDILDIFMYVYDMSHSEALNKIMTVLKAEVSLGAWYLSQQIRLQSLAQLARDLRLSNANKAGKFNLKKNYPELTKALKYENCIRMIEAFVMLGEESLEKCNYRTDKDVPIVASLESFRTLLTNVDNDKCPSDLTIKNWIAKLTYMGIIRQLSIEDIKKDYPNTFKYISRYKIEKDLDCYSNVYVLNTIDRPLLDRQDKLKKENNKNDARTIGISNRQAKSLGIQSRLQVKKETEKIKKDRVIILKELRSFVSKKGYCIRKDFENHMKKKHKFNEAYLNTFVPNAIIELGLEKSKAGDLRQNELFMELLRRKKQPIMALKKANHNVAVYVKNILI